MGTSDTLHDDIHATATADGQNATFRISIIDELAHELSSLPATIQISAWAELESACAARKMQTVSSVEKSFFAAEMNKISSTSSDSSAGNGPNSLRGAGQSHQAVSGADIDVFDLVTAEVSAALAYSVRRGQRLVDEAVRLTSCFPRVFDIFLTGAIDQSTVSAVVERTHSVDTEHLPDVDSAIAEYLTSEVYRKQRLGRKALNRRIDKILCTIDPPARRPKPNPEHAPDYTTQPVGHGMVDMVFRLPALAASAIHESLTATARSLFRDAPLAFNFQHAGASFAAAIVAHIAGLEAAHPLVADAVGSRDLADRIIDARTKDRPRRSHGKNLATVHLSEETFRALAALRNTSDAIRLQAKGTGTTARFGPIPAGQALAILHRADVELVHCHRQVSVSPSDPSSISFTSSHRASATPHTDRCRTSHENDSKDSGAHRYTPSPTLRQRIMERDGQCRFPGCTVPAERCDIDHSRPFRHSAPETGGLTVEENLHCACRHHHRLKTHGGWTEVQHHDGTITFTSPAGMVYTTRPVGVGIECLPTSEQKDEPVIEYSDREKYSQHFRRHALRKERERLVHRTAVKVDPSDVPPF